MIRLLIISAVSGLVLGAMCLAGAFALGGRDIFQGKWRPPAGFAFNWEDNDPDYGDRDRVSDWRTMTGEATSREVAWAPTATLDVGFPADVVYTQASTAKIVVTGPKLTADRFYVEGDQLRLRGWDPSNTFTDAPDDNQFDPRTRPPRLRVEVFGPTTSEFRLSGSESIEIRDYDQPHLSLHLSGASKARVEGRTDDLDFHGSGAAEGDLGGLEAREADVEVSGVARASVNPTETADLNASGASRIDLLRRPASLNQQSSGIARIDEPAAEPVAPAKPAKSKR